MERGWVWLPIALGLGPWLAALRANRQTPLKFAIGWAILAWAAWGLALSSDGVAATYAALTLSGCAGVAVLGARNPGAPAWNFVVLGLLAILLLPAAEGAVTGAIVQLDTIRIVFLTALLGTVTLNYLPTRLGAAAIAFAVGVVAAIGRITNMTPFDPDTSRTISAVAILGVPWLGWIALRFAARSESPVNQLWLGFRDRFGAIWSLRVQEQFNRSAINAGATGRLSWRSAQGDDPTALGRLQALVSKFGVGGDGRREESSCGA